MARFYALGMQADLLAGWALVREWGRIGCCGRVRADAYSELALAEAAGQQLRRPSAARVTDEEGTANG